MGTATTFGQYTYYLRIVRSQGTIFWLLSRAVWAIGNLVQYWAKFFPFNTIACPPAEFNCLWNTRPVHWKWIWRMVASLAPCTPEYQQMKCTNFVFGGMMRRTLWPLSVYIALVFSIYIWNTSIADFLCDRTFKVNFATFTAAMFSKFKNAYLKLPYMWHCWSFVHVRVYCLQHSSLRKTFLQNNIYSFNFLWRHSFSLGGLQTYFWKWLISCTPKIVVAVPTNISTPTKRGNGTRTPTTSCKSAMQVSWWADLQSAPFSCNPWFSYVSTDVLLYAFSIHKILATAGQSYQGIRFYRNVTFSIERQCSNFKFIKAPPFIVSSSSKTRIKNPNTICHSIVWVRYCFINLHDI